MNSKTIFFAFIGGVCASLILAVSFYGIWPARYTSDWLNIPASLEWISYGLTIIVFIMTAMLTGEASGGGSRLDRIKGGVWGGLLVSQIVYSLVGASWAGMIGQEKLFLNLTPPPTSEAEFMIILGTAITGVAWWVTLTFWAMTGIGLILGLLGGALSLIGASQPCSKTHDTILINNLPPFILVIYTSLLLVGGELIFFIMSMQLDSMYQEIGFKPSQIFESAESLFFFPFITSLALLLICALACWRIALSGWDYPVPSARRMIRRIIVLGPILWITSCLCIQGNLFTFRLSVVFLVLFIASAIWYLSGSKPSINRSIIPFSNYSSWPTFLLLMSIFGASFANVSGLSQSLSITLIAVEYIPHLAKSTHNLSSPTVRESIWRLFNLQLTLTTFASVLAIVVLSLIVAIIVRIFIGLTGANKLPPSSPEDISIERNLGVLRRMMDIWSNDDSR